MTDTAKPISNAKPQGLGHVGHLAEKPRRNFLVEAAAFVTGALLAIVPAIAGVLFYLDPLTRRKKSAGAGEGFVRVATMAQLPSDGTPVRFTVQADVVDAWNTLRDQVIGTVYLRRMDEKNVLAFNDICPHLGCKVDFKPADHQFFCPCHSSAFNMDGEKLNKIPPRNMDTLETRLDADGSIWVKYQTFQGGQEAKVVVA